MDNRILCRKEQVIGMICLSPEPFRDHIVDLEWSYDEAHDCALVNSCDFDIDVQSVAWKIIKENGINIPFITDCTPHFDVINHNNGRFEAILREIQITYVYINNQPKGKEEKK